MSQFNFQAEQNVLLSSLDKDGVELAPSASVGHRDFDPGAWSADSHLPRDSHAPEDCKVYDFRRPDKFAKDQLRTLQMLHETFARLFASSLSAYLRVPVNVALLSVEQITYEQYMRSLKSSIINVFSMAPLTGQAILEMELSIILSMIDRLLGGPGSMDKYSYALTDIEKALTESIINRALKEFHTAWEGIAQFTARREIMETQSQFVQIVPPNDVVVCLQFEIKVGGQGGMMSICIPYLLLKPITGKLSAQRWFSNSVKKNTGKHAGILARRLEETHVTCSVRLGTSSITVEELLNLQVGDILPLNRRQHEEVEVLIGDSVKFSARPGIRGNKLAVHINRVLAEPEPIDAARVRAHAA